MKYGQGFHAIEKSCGQNTTKGTEKLGKQLIADVKELHAKIPTAEVTGDLMVQRFSRFAQ